MEGVKAGKRRVWLLAAAGLILSLFFLTACSMGSRWELFSGLKHLSAGSLEKFTASAARTLIPPTETLPATPTVTDTPPAEPTPTAKPQKTSNQDQQQTAAGEEITITILYDNYSWRSGLETAWGFSALIDYGGQRVLFDTGGSGQLLLRNMSRLGVDPGSIQAVVLSHGHGDHTGGLPALISAGARPILYVPSALSASYRQRFGSTIKVVTTHPGQKIGERIYTTGEVSGYPPEQALVLDHSRGLVVITGCAHPGVEHMVRAAKKQLHERPYLVLGGFHLTAASEKQINAVINELQALGIIRAGPCHCSGDQARALFNQAFGKGYLNLGVGRVIHLELQ